MFGVTMRRCCQVITNLFATANSCSLLSFEDVLSTLTEEKIASMKYASGGQIAAIKFCDDVKHLLFTKLENN